MPLTSRRLLAATSAGLAIAATAALASVTLPAAQASPAAATPHAVVQAAAPSTGGLVTAWNWPGAGSPVFATKLSAASAAGVDYFNAGKLSLGRMPAGASLAAVLPDGRTILSKSGRLYLNNNDGSKRLFSQTFQLARVWTVGARIYVQDINNVLYSGTATSAKATRLGTLSGDRGVNAPAVSGSRVYWTQQIRATTPSGAKGISARVVSRPLAGGPVRVESNHSRDPQAVNGGVLVQRITPAKATDVGQLKLGALGLVSAPGKVRQVLEAGTVKTAPAFPTLGLNVTASGDTVTLSDVGRAGQLVINLKTKRAWQITMGRGESSVLTSMSGNRAVWRTLKPVGLSNAASQPGTYLFDSTGNGKLRVIGAYEGTGNCAVNGKTVAWSEIWGSYGVSDANSLVLR